ncbi:DEAD/DEAH box helicase family protein [Planococcus sp. A6]|uniref:type I restriction endonuclease subunit R n=1 Tax=Planococcus sp. A6 TaxID=2992760 RepID=UPI00237C41A8|nr:DEAD/DEAH box helicase family protein [Planococcus sp. A6]MDE0582012.1 DEAD/DEAH box helicase family protein [Planococcus sp. A6]
MTVFQDTEKRFEEDIESFLLNRGGYEKRDMSGYEKEKAININELIAYIEATQEKEWGKYIRTYQSDARDKLFKRLNQEINTNGLLYVLRNGIRDRGTWLKIASFRPESSKNSDVINAYNQNRLTYTRQFAYSSHNRNTIDLVISLNGIPIVAMELKNQAKGQSVDNAKKQFMYDRDERELCFQFNKRFLVYFAVDLYEAWMTTKLEGNETYFLPFNQGSNGAGEVGGAGNPVNEEGYATAYLWEEILHKDVLMDILQRFMHLEGDNKKGRLIFPRFHQLDVVKKLVADVRINGSGDNYLIQHSAGSGKSNSIAWLAYRLSSLHGIDDLPVFTSVIVVTDRKVLDNQLQATISGFDHTTGVVETIGEDKSSQDLKNAINDGKKIIITTLQKFPVIYEDVEDNKGRRFAVIVDEAHSSQTGDSAKKLRSALADTEEALREYAEVEGIAEANLVDAEDKLVKELLSHGRHNNLSFFSFTATPKEKTLEMFGKRQSDGSYRPFHVYSMRQAIEEGFILDVLKNYMTYETSYRIAKDTPDNPEVPTSKGVKAIRRFQELHPHNLQQKTAIMIEQFRDITTNKIGGKAKAMVVTASRLHAVRYYHEFKRYIDAKGYGDSLDILIAFSGVVNDGGIEYRETGMNKTKDGSSISENQLKNEFRTDDFNVLIVAEKYQTGFDEPLLHTMFVDKKLSGVKAVQTLSRLNRTHIGKEDTFILDFVNKTEDIQASFAPYYEATSLDEAIDVNRIYDIRTKIRNYQLYNDEDIAKFLKIYYKKGKQGDKELGEMTSLLKPVLNRYADMSEDEQYDFRISLRNFNKWYAYIIQVARMFDKELHQEYVFTSYLDKFIPKTVSRDISIEDKLKLEYFKLKETFKGDITLNPNTVDSVLKNPKEMDTAVKPVEEDELLETIIERVNDKFQGEFSDGDRVIIEALYRAVKNDQKLKKSAKNNDSQIFEQSIFPDFFHKSALDNYEKSMKSFEKLFHDSDFYQAVMEVVAKVAYKDLRSEK